MKKLLIAALLLFPLAANAQTRLTNYQSGYRTIDGSQLNKMVAAVNALQGTGTPGAVTGTTGTFTGLLTGSGGFTLTGTTSASGVTCATFFTGALQAANTDTVFFVAPRAFRVVSISEVHATAAGGASKLQVTKDSTTNAPGAGTDLLTNNTNAGFDLAATANTVQVGTLVATAGVTSLAAGDRLAVDYADAVQSTTGVAVTACMAPI